MTTETTVQGSLSQYPPRFATPGAVPQTPPHDGLMPNGSLVVNGSLASNGSHGIERQVMSGLLAEPSLRFSSLVVRRTQDGVVLQGVLEVIDEDADVRDLATEVARRVSGVQRVRNDLVLTSPVSPPQFAWQTH